eukprot:COSAG02_NODE_65037_length_259_cov_0.631250_1_plen_44_part_01
MWKNQHGKMHEDIVSWTHHKIATKNVKKIAPIVPIVDMDDSIVS